MKIYRVSASTDYQMFFYDYPDGHPFLKSDLRIFDCKSKLANWPSPAVYIDNPLDPRGNFFMLQMGSGVFVMDAIAKETLAEFWITSPPGELLPLHYNGEDFYILNVLECMNALDEDKTEWSLTETGKRIRPLRYAFHRHRLGGAALFKIPETYRGEILTCEGLLDPEDEFKFNVEQNGLTGLVFEEVWGDEK